MVNPEKAEQILQTHASLVLAVVQTIHNPELKPQLDMVLQQSAQNGWQDLVNVINKILAGNRDQALLNGLDEEDVATGPAVQHAGEVTNDIGVHAERPRHELVDLVP